MDEKEEVLKCHFCGTECNLLKVPKNSINYFKELFSGSEINAITDEDYIYEKIYFLMSIKTELISSFASKTNKEYYIPEGTVCVREDALLGICRWGEVIIHIPRSLKHISKNALVPQ